MKLFLFILFLFTLTFFTFSQENKDSNKEKNFIKVDLLMKDTSKTYYILFSKSSGTFDFFSDGF